MDEYCFAMKSLRFTSAADIYCSRACVDGFQDAPGPQGHSAWEQEKPVTSLPS